MYRTRWLPRVADDTFDRMIVPSLLGGLWLMTAAIPAARQPTCPTSTRTIRVGQASIYIEVCGSGQPVVLIHGGNTDRRMWDREFSLWSHTWKVIRYDVRGFGRSTRPDEPYRSHDDLAAVLDSLAVRRVTIVGLSLGGRIGLDFALTRPDRVRALVLAGPGLSGFPWSRQPDSAWATIGKALERKDSVAAAEGWLRTGYMRPAMRSPTLRPLLRRLARENASSWVQPDREAELEPSAYSRLGEIRAPTLAVVGQLDIPDIQRIVDRIGAEVPGARRVVIRNAGHMVNLEKPAEFDRIVSSFLESLPAH